MLDLLRQAMNNPVDPDLVKTNTPMVWSCEPLSKSRL